MSYGKPQWIRILKRRMYKFITESLCCTAETNAALYINYTSTKQMNELNMLKIKLYKIITLY